MKAKTVDHSVTLNPGELGFNTWEVLAILGETEGGRDMLRDAIAGKYVMTPEGEVRYRP